MTADHELPPTIRQMLRPDFYPYPTSGEVVLVQTHISYVLLTGPYAYKVKKPVKLGFVDFSTLERRRHFCQEEVRLNRRGAPGLYLGVMPITLARGHEGAGDLCLGACGPALEYAVQMRQFPEDALFSHLLESGRLGEPDIDALVGTVAEYHGAAPCDATGRFGRSDDLLAGIREDHRQSERFVGRFLTREGLEETDAFTERFVAVHRDLLDGRIAGGHVRECHGDLHLGNICRWEGRTLLFDCIEFNERYRWIDTMHDAAFTAMDLEARGRPDLANAFVNTYAELTGDWEGLRLLSLYLCRHAFVRAKVSSLLADESEAKTTLREAAGATANRYYELAHNYVKPRRGRLFMMCGPSGSGKTTVARALARRLGALHIRSDALRKHLASVPLHARADAEAYSPRMTDRTYARLLDIGTALAAEGHTVILDARYSRRSQRRQVIEAAASGSLPVWILACTAPAELLRERLDARKGDIADATAELIQAQQEEAEPFTRTEAKCIVRLNTTRPTDELAADVEQLIATNPIDLPTWSNKEQV